MMKKVLFLQSATSRANRKNFRKQKKSARRDARKIFKKCKTIAKNGTSTYQLDTKVYMHANTIIYYLKKWGLRIKNNNDDESLVTVLW